MQTPFKSTFFVLRSLVMFGAILSAALSLLLASRVSAQPQVLTGQYTCATAGDYQLCQNQWGTYAGVGSQNSTLYRAIGNEITWETNWTWANGPNNVKTYANVLSDTAKGVQLSDILLAPTAWTWTYKSQSSGIRADVSYDIWFGNASSGTAATSASSYEIMIWLSGKGGIQPVGSQTVTNVTIAGHRWNLWKGPNANWETISFVSVDGDITHFNADLNDFFHYLTKTQGVAPSQYLQAVQTGTEAFTGSADLLINSFSVSVIKK